MHTRPKLGDVIRRGVRRKCPRCGAGDLFKSWFSLHESCARCSFRIQPKPGDTWGFWIIGDRIFIIVPMVLLYFGFQPEAWWAKLGFLIAVLIPLIATMPHRMGVCIGLDYLSRTYLGGDDD